MNTAVVGMQWGDEGKGKLVDVLTDTHDWIVRFSGGANAGHTVYDKAGQKYAFHVIPSGALHPEKKCVLGNGMVVEPLTFLNEVKGLPQDHAEIFISDRAHVVLPQHIQDDIMREKIRKIGTTNRGIGPAYRDKALREGVRFSDAAFELLFGKDIVKQIKPFVCDTRVLLQRALEKKESIIFEGAQATMLDIDHGTYPYVTSSNTSIGGVYTGTGVRPRELNVIGVMKAYTTRVGEGPFPTELNDDIGKHLQVKGKEVGTTTGRIRRCGWFDGVVARYAAEVNGVDEIALTKLDVLSGLGEILVGAQYYNVPKEKGYSVVQTIPALTNELHACVPYYIKMKGWKEDISPARAWSDLPFAAQKYVYLLEDLVGVPIKYIGVGPGREHIIRK